MSNEKNLESWVSQEATEIEKERKRMMEERGMHELFVLKKGENSFSVDVKISPRTQLTKFGERTVLCVKDAEGEVKDLMLSRKSSLYRIILRELNAGRNQFRILRSGEGRESKFELLK
jgi:hypothetical protein